MNMFKENITIFKRYFKLIKDDRKFLIPFYICVFISSILDLLIPIIISLIIDSLTTNQYKQSIIYTIILAIVYLTDNFLSYQYHIIFANFFKKNYVTLHQKIVNEIYEFDEVYEKKISKGKIINTVNTDLIAISEMADHIYGIWIKVIKLILIFCCFLTKSIEIAIFVLIIDFIYIKLSHTVNNKAVSYLLKQRKNSDELTGLLSQTLLGLKEIKTSNISIKLNEKYHTIRKRWQKNYFQKREWIIIQKVTLKNLIYFGKIIMYIASIYFIFKKRITIGTMTLLISYYDKFFSSSIEIMEKETQIKEENICVERIEQLLRYNKHNNQENHCNMDTLIGKIEFKNIDFSYNKERTLKNISFIALPNKITAIVGKTGSGKTTIFNLLLNLYNPQKGNIYLDKVNINNYNKQEYKRNISILNQDTFIFNLSIRENLNLVNSNKERQIEVCKKLGIHEFIMSLPKKYNTVLNENSTNLSGGQKRLLSLARVLLNDSKILLFDELTSSLDPKTTKTIIKVLKELKKNHTIIIITHKKELMKEADKIIMINKGKKIAEDTHKKLIKSNQFYQELIME